MTRSQLRTRLRQLLNDPDSVYWTDAELHGYVQEAQEVLAEEAPALKRTVVIPRRPGVAVYQIGGISEQLMTPYRLWLPDLHRRLEAVSLTDLDARHREWWEVHGSPWVWASIDWRSFVIWPIPGEGGGQIEVNCYCWPQELLDDGDEPEFHPSAHEALLFYAEHLGRLKQWQVAEATDLFQTFVTRWGAARSQANIDQVQNRFWLRSGGEDDV